MSLKESQKKWIDNVALWLKTQLQSNAENSEIELRFGNYNNKGFVSGVGVAAWKRVQAIFANSDPSLFCFPPKSELEIVTLYETADGGRQAIRRIEHANGSQTLQKKHTESQKNCTIVCGDAKTIAVRLTHSREIAVPDDAKEFSTVAMVRVRARTSFFYKMWRIDLTMVQQGVDRDVASHAPAVYEIEVELLQQQVDWTRYDFHYIAVSSLLRIEEIAKTIMSLQETDELRTEFIDEMV